MVEAGDEKVNQCRLSVNYHVLTHVGVDVGLFESRGEAL